MKRVAAVLLACGLWSVADAQTGAFPPAQLAAIQQGLRDIYSLEHARAVENFERMIRQAPDDPAGYAYLAYTYLAMELAVNQELSIDRFAASDFFSESPKYKARIDPAAEARLRQVSNQAIAKARAKLVANPSDRAALFLLGLAYQNLASFEASLKRSWWSSFRLGNQTFRHHRELLRQDPNFHDARLAIGVYQYVTARLGWNVKWLAFLLGYRGSKQRGKEELQLAAQLGLLAADDAHLVLTLIHTREKNYQKAFDLLAELLRKYPQNYLVHLDMGGMRLLMKQPGEAVKIYQEIARQQEARAGKYGELERATVYNRLGVALREKGDLDEAAQWFEKAMAGPAVSARSATVARLELGKTLDLMGRREEARERYRLVAQAEDIAGSRQEAQELLRRPYHRN